MILYFSGTGNSAYVANRLGNKLNDEVINLFEKVKHNDYTTIENDRPWVIVTPTYAWRIPRILNQWLEKTKLAGNKEIYFVMTCGNDIGNAAKHLKKLCTEMKLNDCGCLPIVMPENYIALFSTPTKEEALMIIEKAEESIDNVAYHIKQNNKFPQHSITVKDKLNSSIVNDVFYTIFVSAKKFHVKEDCVSCGKCAMNCPLSNIHIKSGKPVWGSKCTHCMACICHCPVEAIEYGKHSIGLPRYTCPK